MGPLRNARGATSNASHHRLLAAAALALAIAVPRPALACATCGCSLSTDAAMGYSDVAGWRATLRIRLHQSGPVALRHEQHFELTSGGDQRRRWQSGSREADHQPLLHRGHKLQAQWRVEFQPAGALHRPQPLHLWRVDEPSHARQGKRCKRGQPGGHPIHHQLSGFPAYAQPRLSARADFAHRRLWRAQCRWHRHRRTQPRRLQLGAQLAESRRQAISSTPACKLAPAPPTSLSVRTTTRR